MSIQSINPATGEVLENFPETTSAEIERILQSTDATFEQWRRRPFAGARETHAQAAQVLRNGKEKYARTMALEMGKPIVQGEAEVEKCAWCCDYYAENAASVPGRAAAGDRRIAQLRPFRSDRSGAGDHAVEFSLLAGVSLCRAGADGGQRGNLEACLQRAALRAADRRGVSRSGISGESFSHASGWLRRRSPA